jgi:hypothetical protein
MFTLSSPRRKVIAKVFRTSTGDRTGEPQHRALFMLALFITIFITSRLFIQPINTTDFDVHIRGLSAFWQGQDPYAADYVTPPWSLLLLAPIMHQPIQTWLALSITLFVCIILDLGRPAGLITLIHPVIMTLIASANPEWIYIGTGLWIIHRFPNGWGRGVGWLFLTCKPQTAFLFLLVDGVMALRERDWRAIVVSGVVAVGSVLFVPDYLNFLQTRLHMIWSVSVLYHLGVVGAVVVTVAILALRAKRVGDLKTLALLLAPVWTPYIQVYSYVAVLFTMRRVGWMGQALYFATSLIAVWAFWQAKGATEFIPPLIFVLMASLLAPDYRTTPANDTQPPPAT